MFLFMAFAFLPNILSSATETLSHYFPVLLDILGYSQSFILMHSWKTMTINYLKMYDLWNKKLCQLVNTYLGYDYVFNGEQLWYLFIKWRGVIMQILICTFNLIINYLLASDHYEQTLQANTYLGIHTSYVCHLNLF